MAWLNVSQIIEATYAEGPGLRFALWVQGCLKRCKGCCNPQFLEIRPANFMDSEELIDLLKTTKANNPLLEGVTLLGGEPFLQAPGLAKFAQAAQEMGLSVMVFTGYLKEEIVEEKFRGSQALLAHTDLLIDGEFERENIETERNWVGSTNQRFHYLSDFYDPSIETMDVVTNEFRFSKDGVLLRNGLPLKIRNLH